MTHTNIPEGYISRKSSTVDFGYELSEIEGYLKPIPFELECLKKAENKVKNGESTRKVSKWLSLETNRYISNVGLWKHITKKNESNFKFICNKQEEGYVYVLTNPAWNSWVKVGMAVDPGDRCSTFQTSSPFRDYEIYFSKKFNNKKEAEATAHHMLKKVADEYNNEWFLIDKKIAKALIQVI